MARRLVFSSILRAIFSFIREYIIRGDFIGGAYGYLLAMASMGYTLDKYLMLWQMNKKRLNNNEYFNCQYVSDSGLCIWCGRERVIWDLAKELVKLGHQVTFLVPKGSHCDFAKVIEMNPALTIAQQIPDYIDVAHLQFQPKNCDIKIPYVVTEHGNAQLNEYLDKNTIFVSRDHAKRHNSDAYVLNGLDWSNYGEVDWAKDEVITF